MYVLSLLSIITLVLTVVITRHVLKHNFELQTRSMLDELEEEMTKRFNVEDKLIEVKDQLYHEISKYQAKLDVYDNLDINNMVDKETFTKVVNEAEDYKSRYSALDGKQRSERTRLGQVSENIIPFLTDFPYDPKKIRGLFNPIDLIVFEDDEIVFVEVKSGDSGLSTKQRNIRKLIEEGKVRFEVHRLNKDGYTKHD